MTHLKLTSRSVGVVGADLTAKGDVQRVERILHSDKDITLLVKNACVGATRPMVDSDVESLESMISLNVTALTRLTRAVLPVFVARGNGTVINIASIVALAPELLNGTYGGTKAFVLALSQSLDHELRPKGIQIQAVLPGATGRPVSHLPTGIVMNAEEMVDAALVGFDRKELVTIPSLPDVADWEAFDAARRVMGPQLSRSSAASRYQA